MTDESEEARPWDLLNPNKPLCSEEVRQERFKICESCQWFKPRSKTCKKCGCFMNLKTHLLNAKCPIGKW